MFFLTTKKAIARAMSDLVAGEVGERARTELIAEQSKRDVERLFARVLVPSQRVALVPVSEIVEGDVILTCQFVDSFAEAGTVTVARPVPEDAGQRWIESVDVDGGKSGRRLDLGDRLLIKR